jgi:hypothetical protein
LGNIILTTDNIFSKRNDIAIKGFISGTNSIEFEGLQIINNLNEILCNVIIPVYINNISNDIIYCEYIKCKSNLEILINNSSLNTFFIGKTLNWDVIRNYGNGSIKIASIIYERIIYV